MTGESQLVTWTIESNADGQWALYMRAGGTATQLSDWYDSPKEIYVAIQRMFSAHETVDAKRADV
jgi:hypothetical protein